MKRLFIIVAVCLILALATVWGYLLFYGAPESTRDFFANFNFGDTEDSTAVDTPPLFEIEVSDTISDPSVLRQLTTKPVAGYNEVTTSTASSSSVYYIEAGTGHIYSLDKITGAEIRISNITVPNTRLGFINASGTTAVIQSGDPGEGELTVVSMTGASDTATSFPLITSANDFTLTDRGEVLYTLKTATGLEGFSYDLASKTTRNIFTLPFREATIRWGATANADHFAYPDIQPQLEGYLYKLSNGALSREPFSGFGFSANGTDMLTLYSYTNEETYTSIIHNRIENTTIESNYSFIPDKCVFSNQIASAVCATPTVEITSEGVLDWYKGVSQNTDGLLLINSSGGQIEPVFLIDLKEVSGRNIDAINLVVPKTEGRIYFQNKIDQTLWLFDIS